MRKNTILFSIVLFVAGIAVYFNSFSNGFIWDDQTIIVSNEFIRNWSNLPAIFTKDLHHFSLEQSNFYRPLQTLSYTVDYTFWKLNPMGYHISNTIGHIINAILLFFLFNAVGQRLAKEEIGTKWISFFTSLIWLVHPIHTQCTTYASGRADILMMMFILSGVLSHIARKTVLTAVFFIFALLSKEYALVTPLLLLLIDYFLIFQQKEWKLEQVFKRYTSVLVISTVYIILRITVLSFPSSSSETTYPDLFYRVLTSAKAIFILLGSLAAPFKLSFLRNIDWVSSGSYGAAFLCMVAVLILLILSFVSRKKYPQVAFGLFWFFLCYLPYMNIIPLNANVSEHWMYLSSGGLIYAVINVFKNKVHTPRRHQVAVCFMVFLVIVYGFRLVKRNFDFRNEIIFYEKEIQRNPNNALIHYNLGTAYIKKNNYEKGITYLEKTIVLDPKYASAYGNLGQAYDELGQADKAIEYFEKADSMPGELIENLVNLAHAYAQAGQYEKAIPLLKKTLKLRPNHIGGLNGLGIEYGRRGEFDKAEGLFKQVLQIDPNNNAAQRNLDFLEKLR